MFRASFHTGRDELDKFLSRFAEHREELKQLLFDCCDQDDQGFRTVKPFIEWGNYAFSRIIKPKENYQPDYQFLAPYRADPGMPPCIIPEPEDALEDSSADEIRIAEAEASAEKILEAVGKWKIDENGAERVLKYGDLALLFPTTTGLEHYEEALRRRKIPFRLEGGKKFFQRVEIVALSNLLQAISNPYDRVAMIASTRYWGGVSDERLFLFKKGERSIKKRDQFYPK